MSGFRTIGEQERERFDAFAEKANGHPCQSFAWGEADRIRGWQPVRAMFEEDGRIVATLVALRKPLARFCLMDAMFGPVADFSDDETARRVTRALGEFARRQRALYLRINPEAELRGSLARILFEEGFRPARSEWRYSCTIAVSLSEPLESIHARMEKRAREAIRRAQRLGIEVSAVQDGPDIEAFLEIYQDTCRRKGLPAASARYLRSLCENNHLNRLFLARCNGAPAAASVCYTFGRRIVGAFGASAHPCPPGAGTYVEWQVMRWGKEHRFIEYDLGGIPCNPRPADDQWGVYFFKRSLGGRTVQLVGEYERCVVPALTGVFGRLIGARSRLKRRLSRVRVGDE